MRVDDALPVSTVVLVPVLGRPHRVRPLLDSLAVASPDASVLFIADPGDEDEIEAIEDAGAAYITVDGGYARKINEGVRRTSEELIFLGADDLAFHPGWLEAASARLVDGVGVVGTNDLGNERVIRGEHSTHSLLTRRYAELGTIDGAPGPLSEAYHHWFLDDELVATAKHRGAWAFAGDAIVEHLHPFWGKAADDVVYRKANSQIEGDRAIFIERAKLWGGAFER